MQNAIGNSANIFLQGAQLGQQNNQRIFDAITNAARMYEDMQARREANANALRMKQMDLDAQAQADAQKQKAAMFSDEGIQALAAKKALNPQSMTPEENAALQTGLAYRAAQMTADLSGNLYPKFDPAGLMQSQPAFNAVGGAPMAAAVAPSVKTEILPPPSGVGKPDMSLFSTPSPIGRSDEKLAAPFSVSSNIKNSTAGQLKANETNLDIQKNRIIKQEEQAIADQAKEKEKSFYANKLQKSLEKLAKLNDDLKAGGDVTTDKSSALNAALNSASGIELPFTGTKIGRGVERMFDKKAARNRDIYDGEVSQAVQLMKKVGDMSAGQMNSDADIRNIRQMFGSPNGSYEGNKKLLNDLAEQYGTGALFKEDPTQSDTKKTDSAKPKMGDEQGGYIFLGGNPADPSRWRKKK